MLPIKVEIFGPNEETDEETIASPTGIIIPHYMIIMEQLNAICSMPLDPLRKPLY